MLLMLFQWLQGLSPEFGFLRVFQYLTLRAVLAAMTALLLGLFIVVSAMSNVDSNKFNALKNAILLKLFCPRTTRLTFPRIR